MQADAKIAAALRQVLTTISLIAILTLERVIAKKTWKGKDVENANRDFSISILIINLVVPHVFAMDIPRNVCLQMVTRNFR